MPFQFQPLTDEEINALQGKSLLPKGIYPFIVREAKEKYSQSGNAMLQLRIGILIPNAQEISITDYLVSNAKMVFKIKHFCEAVGLFDKYEKGILTAHDCLNRKGKVNIDVESGQTKKDGVGVYPDKNIVKDYIKAEISSAYAKKDDSFMDSDLPF